MDKCIILVAHISNSTHATILKNCIDSIKQYSPNYPILLCSTGDVSSIYDQVSRVDHHIFTSINTLDKTDSPLSSFFVTSNWKITYNIPTPRYYYGFAQVQKTALALQGAISLGYKNFLVMNYDTLFLESGFADYMFSESESVFFNFAEVRMSSDMFKLNMDGARAIIRMSDYKTYDMFAQKHSGNMLEDVLGEMLSHYNINFRKLPASNNSMFQLSPFKILVNNSYNEGAMAAIHDGMVYLLISSQGHPRYTLDGKIDIWCNRQYTTFDVSAPTALLYPIAPYEGKDIEIVIRTNFGEVPVRITKQLLENSTIEWF